MGARDSYESKTEEDKDPSKEPNVKPVKKKGGNNKSNKKISPWGYKYTT